jgi:hypothetical protein
MDSRIPASLWARRRCRLVVRRFEPNPRKILPFMDSLTLTSRSPLSSRRSQVRGQSRGPHFGSKIICPPPPPQRPCSPLLPHADFDPGSTLFRLFSLFLLVLYRFSICFPHPFFFYFYHFHPNRSLFFRQALPIFTLGSGGGFRIHLPKSLGFHRIRKFLYSSELYLVSEHLSYKCFIM